MHSIRTFTTFGRTGLRLVLLLVAVLGLVRFPDIPYLDQHPRNPSFLVTAHGSFPSPRDMTNHVTLPLEVSLSQAEITGQILSRTSSKETKIRIDLPGTPDQNTTNQLRQLIRQAYGRFSDHTNLPRLEREDVPLPPVELICWIPRQNQSVRIRITQIVNNLRSVRGIARVEEPGIRRSDLPPDKTFHGHSGMAAALNEHANVRGQALSFRDHVTSTPFLARFQMEEPLEKVIINNFEGVLIRIFPDPDSNVLWNTLRLRKQLSLMNKTLGISHLFLTDPYRQPLVNVTWQAVACVVLILLASLLHAGKNRKGAFWNLLYPGLFMFFFSLSGLPMDPQVLMTMKYCWAAAIFLQMQRAPGVTLIQAAILCCLAAGAAAIALHEITIPVEKGVFMAIPSGILALLFIQVTVFPLKKRRMGTTLPSPALAFSILVSVLGIINFLPPFDRIGNSLQTGKRSMPTAGKINEIRLVAWPTTFAPEPHYGPDSVISLLRQFQPDELIQVGSPEKHELIGRWKHTSAAHLFSVQSVLKPLLLYQTGIRWSMEGPGEPFQNDRTLIPGRYRIVLSGPDYENLLFLATRAADSLRHLPGIGTVNVNQEIGSESDYYVLHNSDLPAGGGLDHIRLYQAMDRHWDTLSLAHQPVYATNGRRVRSPKPELLRQVTPAPVVRVNNRYHMTLDYEHYGGEKYAKRFYRDFRNSLTEALPFSYAVETTSARAGELNVFRMPVTLLVIFVLMTGIVSRKGAIRVTGMLLISMLAGLWYCYIRQYTLPVFATPLLGCTGVLIVLTEDRPSTRTGIATGLILFESILMLTGFSGTTPVIGELLIVSTLPVLISGMITGGRNFLFSRGRKGFQQLFDFFRFGVITKFLK